MTARPPGAAVPGARLLLLGVSVRALARSACAGLLARRLFPGGITALDYFGDWDLLRLPVRGLSLRRDLGRPRSVTALMRAASGLEWDAVVYAGGIENRPGLLEALERRGTILGNGARAVRAVRDPGGFFGFLNAAGIPHAATPAGAAGRPGSAPGADRSPGLWKPRRSGGGGRLRPAAPGEPRPRGFFFQERLRGIPASIAFVADGRRAVLLGASEQLAGFRPLGGSGFRYGGSIAGPATAIIGRENLDLLATAATAITRRFGLVGLNGLDLVLSTDGVARIIEINPRFTASMELLEELAGRNFFDLHLRAAQGPLRRWTTSGTAAWTASGTADRDRFLAKGILYAGRPLRGGRPGALQALGCRDIPVPGEWIGTGAPVLTVMASGPSPEACRRELEKRAREARRVLAGCDKIPVKRAIHRQSGRRPVNGRAGGTVRHGIL